MSIGQDILMQAVENGGPFVWSTISVLLWSLFAWFSSRLVADCYTRKNGKYISPSVLLHAPRLIGYNVFVGLQLATLNLPTVYFSGKSTFTFFLLFIAHNAYYFLLDKTVESREKKLKITSLIIAVLYVVFIAYAFLFSDGDLKDGFLRFGDYKQHVWIWCIMSMVYFTLQILFICFVVERRKRLENKKISEKDSKWWKTVYNLCAIVTFFIYLLIITFPKFADWCGPLTCLLLALGIWIGIICLVKYYSLKWKVRFGIPFLIVAVVIGLFGNPYKVELLEAPRDNLYNERPNIKTYLTEWATNKSRYDMINQSDSLKPYPVYLVLADGGASKSGYWVASVLSMLEESDSEKRDKFSDHLLSLAGASGGSVGNAAFYSLLKKDKNVNFSLETDNFFEGDFLSYTLAHYLGSDLFKHLFPFLRTNDRAAALEESMEKLSESELINNTFKDTINSIFDNKAKLPLLFINTTSLQTGTPGVISNIKINKDFTNRMDVLQQLDSIPCTCEGKIGKSMKLSTAVVLGSRFPYLSPAGEINGKYFVDGGYFDNSGGGITLELLEYIDKFIKENKDDSLAILLKKMQFKVIYISNGENSKQETKRLHPLINDLAAPLLTVVGINGQQTNNSNQKLEKFINNWPRSAKQRPFHTLNLPMDSPKSKRCLTGRDDCAPYPMNWVISDYNLNRIKLNLNCINPDSVLIYHNK
ncbi:patatin-like phospholipase family protein [Flavobacterium enshiense]|nr:patatin-like phospholipase family protein [Flavobacterium enshiense]